MVKVVICYGALRSGTTLLRLMLNQHSRIDCPGEADFLVDHLEFDAGGAPVLDRVHLEQDRFRTALDVPMPQSDGRAAVAEMIQSLASDDDRTLVLILHRGLVKLHRLFPEFPILHLVRDPRDVARSSIGMGWAGNVYYGANHWIETEQEWDHFTAQTGTQAAMELRYEALIHDPDANLHQLLSAIGLDWEDTMLDYVHDTTYDKPCTDLVEQWRRKQTPLEIALVEHRVGALMQARGYSPAKVPAVQPGGMLRTRLFLQDVFYRWTTRLHRFGLADTLLEFIGRRLGIRALYLPAQRRINEKSGKYVK